MQVCFPQTPPHPTTHTPFPSHDVARGALPQVTQCKISDPVCSHPPVNSDFFCARIDGGSQGRDARCQLPLLGLQSSLSVQMDEQNALIFLGLETRSMRRMVSFAHAEISLATKKKKIKKSKYDARYIVLPDTQHIRQRARAHWCRLKRPMCCHTHNFLWMKLGQMSPSAPHHNLLFFNSGGCLMSRLSRGTHMYVGKVKLRSRFKASPA